MKAQGGHLVLRSADLAAERPAGASDDIHFTEALAESVIAHTTQPGDLVLDPFAGYGTTLVVAERLGRRAIGVELIADHVAICRSRVGPAVRIVEGDARRLSELIDEPVDLALTSPPYMAGEGHPENPLTGYTTADGEYATYLRELGSVFRQVAELLRPGGQLVVNVANVVGSDGRPTPLASDVAALIAQHIPLLGTTTLRWDEPPAGLDGDFLLWFGHDDAVAEDSAVISPR
jgi:DNA modification methylase